MPVITDTVLAMRCPECGKMGLHKLSRFDVGKNSEYRVVCSCGALKAVLKSKDRSRYNVSVSCVYCDGSHTRSIAGKHFWSGGDSVIELFCPDTGMELAHFGPDEAVRQVAAEQVEELDNLISEFGNDGYFHNSAVMQEVLKCLHRIADRGMLHCQCGDHQIGVDIFPDRLELHCKNCDSINIVYAETDDDLQVIQQVEEIELARNGFGYLDSLVNTGKTKKTSKPK